MFYDSMIAKVIVWDESRIRAIQKMKQVLKESIIFGVHTNIPFLLEILSHHEFIQGTMTTRFIDRYFNEPLKPPQFSELDQLMAAQVKKLVSPQIESLSAGIEFISPWSSFWRGV